MKMKKAHISLTAIAMVLAAMASGHAQTMNTMSTQSDSSDSAETPAIATPDSRNPTAPVEGRNSFTKAQATQRFTDAGFTRIRNMTKGNDGVWRATGMRNGQKVPLALDYQGNITSGTSRP